ncbi:MAG: ATP synthase F1 subunit epsilon [Chloroherpetonaceae bacterium]|nr:ATP synthase F1 subunit epsilon [Chloroherpetonaceae bacterium]MCS7210403.1 ATP synthase F1 subunit epsilon [Chloroherpetonaceae bacterium]MDW8019278.1 ATP synthase F1 subunit epsilon [Chloroherpetonaceae bacterium]MDW8466056.1 ATP synthase F1 subunit epsilon [Chloroherpetonaceae bacterium]
MAFQVEIVTPLRSVFEGEVVSLTLPGVVGSFQILQNHAPILAALQEGELRIELPDKSKQTFKISSGFVEMNNNRAIVIAENIQNT